MKKNTSHCLKSPALLFSDGHSGESIPGEILKKSLVYSNQQLSKQIEKNNKHIQSLKTVLNFLESLPQLMTPEVRALVSTLPGITINYDFELILLNEIHKFICKSKYFTLEIELNILSNQSISYYEKIPIELKLYTSEETPKVITQTMHGLKIIRGQETTSLTYNINKNKFTARMKVQIREVSSHYINGTLNLVVTPKNQSEYLIKPLILKDIVIKAKEKACQRLRGF
jgi:hypothetical protein